MRILVVTQYFWPEDFRVNDVVGELVRRGHCVTVLTGIPNYPEGRVFSQFRSAPKAFSEYEGAEILRVPLLPRGIGGAQLMLNYLSFALTASVMGSWRLRRDEFDVVFMFEPSPISAAIPARLIAAQKKIPMLIWVLDLWPDILSALGIVRSRMILGLVGRLVSWVYKGSAFVLGQSQAFKDSIQHYSRTDKKFRYLPGWAEPAFAGPIKAVRPAPEVAQFLDGTFNVMFAGNLGESQGFQSVLSAAEALRERNDIRFLLVGEGRMGHWIREQIAARGLANVHMLGRHPIERMPAFFVAASALLVSLRSEPTFTMTIPGKVQAYLAAGLPILGMLSGEGARIINESGAGLTCEADDAEGLATAILRMAEMSPAMRAEMGAQGQAFARKEFDRATLIGRIEGWMREAILQNQSPRSSRE